MEKLKYLSIIKYTLLGIIGTTTITLVFNYIFGIQLQSAFLFFIIPIGGIYIGIGGSLGLFYSYYHFRKTITYKQYIIALILAVFVFYNIYYFSYTIFSNEINSFIKYLEFQQSSGEMLFGFGKVATTTSINTGKIINMISFYLQLFGSLIGAIGVGMYFHMKLDEKK